MGVKWDFQPQTPQLSISAAESEPPETKKARFLDGSPHQQAQHHGGLKATKRLALKSEGSLVLSAHASLPHHSPGVFSAFPAHPESWVWTQQTAVGGIRWSPTHRGDL